MIFLEIDQEVLEKERIIDGCYVLKTDLKREVADKKTAHDRYKDLTLVEQVFRTSKEISSGHKK